MHRLRIITILLAVSFLLSACGGRSSDLTYEGETWQVASEKIEEIEVPNKPTERPAADHTFLKVTLKTENLTCLPGINNFGEQVYVTDSQGEQYFRIPLFQAKLAIVDGQVQKGKCKESILYFEIPKSSKGLELHFFDQTAIKL
jgi:hypothetical protein